MRTLLTALFVLLLAAPAVAGDLSTLTATNTGVNGDALADTPSTDALAMDSVGLRNQLTLHIAVTWGTSTSITATCKTAVSESGTYTWVNKCLGTNPVVCAPLVWTWYAVDNPDGLLTLEHKNNDKFAICVFDDAADGTGTAVVTGSRGRQ